MDSRYTRIEGREGRKGNSADISMSTIAAIAAGIALVAIAIFIGLFYGLHLPNTVTTSAFAAYRTAAFNGSAVTTTRETDVTLVYWSAAADYGTFDAATGEYDILSSTFTPMIDLAACPDGTMFGLDASGANLYAIVAATGESTLIDALGDSLTPTNLACSNDGTLYTSAGGVLYTVNPTTAAVTSLGSLPGAPTSCGDLVVYGAYLYFGTSANTVYRIDVANVTASTTVGYLGLGSACAHGLAELYYNGSTHLWAAIPSVAMTEVDVHSGSLAPLTATSTKAFQGATSFCWANTSTVLQTYGNVNVHNNEITEVRAVRVDNLFSSGAYESTNTINVHNNLRASSGSNVTFDTYQAGPYAAGLVWGADSSPTTTLYRSAAATLETDGTLASIYKLTANGNVASAVIGSKAGVRFQQNVASVGGLLTVGITAGGTGYAVADVLTVTGCSGTGATATVTTVASGVVTAVTIVRPGAGYTVTTGCTTTTGGSGTGATINILTIGAKTVTSTIGYQATPINAAGTYVTPAVTTATGVQIADSNLGSGPATLGTLIGIDVVAQTVTTTNSYGMRLAAPTGGATINQALNFVSGTTAAAGATFGADAAPSVNLYRSAANMLKTDADLTVRHVVPLSSAIPTVAAGTGAGTGPTITVSAASTDCKMQITVLTGSTPTAAGAIMTVTYNNAFTGTVIPGVVFSAANAAAAALSSTTSPYVSSETLTTFVFTAGSAALTGATTYKYSFQVCS